MKTTILFTILFLSSSLTYTQSYLDQNPRWTESTVSCGGGNPFCIYNDYEISLASDTTINSIEYHQTRKVGMRTTWNWVEDTLVSITPIDNFESPIREDNGRFYRYRLFDETEELLHDFNLTVGDTAVSNAGCSNPQIVMQIDTVIFGNQERKKFIFLPDITFGASPLYEGIGTSRGLFVRPCGGTIGIESGSTLQCYTTGSQTIQLDTTGLCETTISTNTLENTNDSYKLYPNPTTNTLIISGIDANADIEAIKLFDIYGNLVITKTLHSKVEKLTLELDSVPSGNYILLIHSKGKINTAKIIKV